MLGDKAKCYSGVVLDLLYPITPTIDAHQRRLSATIPLDLPIFPGAAWPTIPRLRVFHLGGAQRREDVAPTSFVTRRNNQNRHASLLPRRMTRDQSEDRPSSRCRSHERRLTYANDDRTPGRSGPGDILQGTNSGGNLSTSSWRDRRITCWEYVRISQNSSSFSNKLFKEIDTMQTEAKFWVK